MRVLHLVDRVSRRGGADLHLRDVLARQRRRHRLTLAYGRSQASLPAGVQGRQVRGLGSPVASTSGLAGLDELLQGAEIVHLHNIMNPTVLSRAVATGRAVVTVQDHRVFCPGPGRSLPDGAQCHEPMGDRVCAICLPDPAYRQRTLALTQARLQALVGARLVVLSQYMARELDEAGLPGAVVVPPWIEVGEARRDPGEGFVLGGRLVRHKAPELAWEAWRTSGTSQPLRVAGAGPLEDRLVGAQRLGWVPRPALRELLAGSRALLFPGHWQEPFGILGLEALASGTPVIATPTGGVEDWAVEGVIRARDLREWVEAIRLLDREPERARALGEAGRAFVERRFGVQGLSDRLEHVYASVAGA